MAGGKTTFGRALAERLGWEFHDLDEMVEEREGRSVSAIMAEEGESYFRKAESALLKETSSLHKVVIACGGGTPCYRDNMEFMTLHGITLWLIASPERIAERILEAPGTRPLLSGKKGDELLSHIRSHLLARQPYYCRAMLRHSGEHLENAEEIRLSVDAFMPIISQTLQLK